VATLGIGFADLLDTFSSAFDHSRSPTFFFDFNGKMPPGPRGSIEHVGDLPNRSSIIFFSGDLREVVSREVLTFFFSALLGSRERPFFSGTRSINRTTGQKSDQNQEGNLLHLSLHNVQAELREINEHRLDSWSKVWCDLRQITP
jgi:hypothetical protein